MSIAKATKCSPASTCGSRSKSRLSLLNLAIQPKLRSTTQLPGQQHEPLLRLGQLHHLQLDPRRLGVVFGLIEVVSENGKKRMLAGVAISNSQQSKTAAAR